MFAADERQPQRQCQGGDAMPTKPEDVLTDRTRPFTGREYLESLRDGREVYI
jgi:hypothetical protein